MNEYYLDKNINTLKISLVELYMELCICFFITAQDINLNSRNGEKNTRARNLRENSGSERFSYFLWALSGLFIFGVPFYILARIYQIMKNPFQSDSSFFIGVDIKARKVKSLVIYPIVFMARRMTFVSLSIFFTNRDSFDALLTAVFFMMTQFMISTYLLKKQPLDSF